LEAAKSALATGFRTRLQAPEAAPLQTGAAWFPISPMTKKSAV
jgi:hypothetical protein